jgi:hypothetical protein
MDESFYVVYDRPRVKLEDTVAVDEHPRTSKAFVKLQEVVNNDSNNADGFFSYDAVSSTINDSCASCNKTMISILNKKLSQSKSEYKAFNLELYKLQEKSENSVLQQSSEEGGTTEHDIERMMKENDDLSLEIEDVREQIRSVSETIDENLASEGTYNGEISAIQSEINTLNLDISLINEEMNNALKCLEASNREILTLCEYGNLGDLFKFSPKGYNLYSDDGGSVAPSPSFRSKSLSSVFIFISNVRDHLGLAPTLKVDFPDDFTLELSLIPLVHGPKISLSFYSLANRSHKYQESLSLYNQKYSTSGISEKMDCTHILPSLFFIAILVHSIIEMSRIDKLSSSTLRFCNAFREFGHLLILSLLGTEFDGQSTKGVSLSGYEYLLVILLQDSDADPAGIALFDLENKIELIFQECLYIMLF